MLVNQKLINGLRSGILLGVRRLDRWSATITESVVWVSVTTA
jgi:hypothetical protein